MMKKIATILKNFCTFAVETFSEGGIYRLIVVAVFFISATQTYGSITPCGIRKDHLPSKVFATGSVEPFFYSLHKTRIQSVMQTRKKSCLRRKDVSRLNASIGTKTVPICRFLLEKNLKNKAYAFIIQHNLLESFETFTEETSNVDDFHEYCLILLEREKK